MIQGMIKDELILVNQWINFLNFKENIDKLQTRRGGTKDCKQMQAQLPLKMYFITSLIGFR